MGNYTCNRCGESFKLKHHLIQHFHRKVPCLPNLEDLCIRDLLEEIDPQKQFVCLYCEKSFTTNKSLKRHTETVCKCRQTTHIYNNTNSNNTTNTTNIINNTYNINNTINIINNFGSENIDYILNDKTFLEKCIKNLRSSGMMNLIERIHYCLNHPENHNVRLKSQRYDQLEIYKNQEWHIMDKNTVLDRMITKGYKVLHTFYHDEGNSIKEYDQNEQDGHIFYHMTKIQSKDKNTYYPIRKQICGIVVNNKFYLMEGPEEVTI